MTEAEWLAATDPTPMLQFHEHTASERKLRLFHVGCCERVEHLLVDARSRSALACARRYADGRADADEWRDEAAGASGAWGFTVRRAGVTRYGTEFDRMTRRLSTGPGLDAEMLGFDPAANAAAVLCAVESPYTVERIGPARYAAHAVELESGSEVSSCEQRGQSHFLRDIFGNPFRPMTLDPKWLTSTVATLAEGVYTERAFDRIPILADALQDAGCDSDDLLNHLRGGGPHVRGCWVVDLLTGRE
jgi:hypothetical protein